MIRAQTLAAGWQTLGVDLYRGVEPEGVTPIWGPSGPESLTFTLQRPPGRVQADLAPFTPVELYPTDSAEGDPVWAGYTVQSPPGRGGEATTVTCVGWHQYREDHPAPAGYLHERLTDWTDMRADLRTNLAQFVSVPQVNVGDGQILLVWPRDTTVRSGTGVGVVLDLGPDPSAQPARIAVDYAQIGTLNANDLLHVRTADDPSFAAATPGTNMDDFSGSSFAPAASGTFVGNATATRRRYVLIFLWRVAADGVSSGSDYGLRITGVRVASSTAYLDAGGASALTADQVIKAARNNRAPALSSSDERITAVSFPIRHAFWGAEDVTVREQQDRVNDYHGYRLGVDSARRVFFLPQPAAPRLQVDADAVGVSFRDQSTNDGSELYNHANVRGRSGSGEALFIERWLQDYTGPEDLPSALGFFNPSFTVDTSGWTNTTRDTTIASGGLNGFRSSPAGGIMAAGATAGLTGGTFKAGRPYRIRVYCRVPQFTSGPRAMLVKFGLKSGLTGEWLQTADLSLENGSSVTQWVQAAFLWMPKADISAANVLFVNRLTGAIGGNVRVDDGSITEPVLDTLLARGRIRSFTLNVGAPTDTYSMDALARAFLLAHRYTPFRGSLAVTGDAIVDLVTGNRIRSDRLGPYTGEMIRVLGVTDPDTGTLGTRDGIIASVNGLEPASLALDSERRSFEALAARMGVFAK